jgi:protein-disulfide isomerase
MNIVSKAAGVFCFALSMTMLAFAADGSLLKPPAGAKVAVVVFEDLECPSCANAYPKIWEAANAGKVPVVLHDFPLSKHPWAFQAAIYARFFDTKSQKLGNDFRGFIYKNQVLITPNNLQQYASKFADDNKVPLPFAIDPQGELKAKVQADYDLGVKSSLSQTPTIFVVGSAPASPSFIEVSELDKLPQAIEEMQSKIPASTPSSHAPNHKRRQTASNK